MRIQHRGHHANNTAELSPARQSWKNSSKASSSSIVDPVVGCSLKLFRSLARDCLVTLPKETWKPRSPNYNPGLYCLLWTSQPVFYLLLWSSTMRPIKVTVTALIGSLSNNDGDGCENVTKKVNLRCFKRYPAYSISFTSSNVGKCFWSWILKDYQSSGKEKESFCLVFPSTRKRERYDCAVTAKKCKKRVTHVQSCCFANLNLLLFYRSLCRRRRRCLSSLISPPRTWE